MAISWKSRIPRLVRPWIDSISALSTNTLKTMVVELNATSAPMASALGRLYKKAMARATVPRVIITWRLPPPRAIFPMRRSCWKENSRPMENKSSETPSSAVWLTMTVLFIIGPITTPARIYPSMGLCRNLWARLPNTKAAPRSMTNSITMYQRSITRSFLIYFGELIADFLG